MKQGVHVSGASPESISSLLSEVAECGTHYTRLSHFSLQPVLDSSCSKGLVFQVRPRFTLLRDPGRCTQACPGASEPDHTPLSDVRVCQWPFGNGGQGPCLAWPITAWKTGWMCWGCEIVGGSCAGCWGRGPACGVEGARAAWSPWRGTEPGLPESLVVGAHWADPQDSGQLWGGVWPEGERRPLGWALCTRASQQGCWGDVTRFRF